MSLRVPYPLSAPARTLTLPLDHGHAMHVRCFGAEEGIPALVLHGGPGSGAAPILWRVLDPQRYRIIVPDQRGSGESTPRGRTEANTLADLLADLRVLRSALGTERWLVLGGSWGSTLALAHAADAPDAILALLLRAIFLARDEDIAAFFEGGPSLAELAFDLAQGGAVAQQAARRWHAHEAQRAGLVPTELEAEELARQVDRLRVQAHYLLHGCWLREQSLLDRCAGVPRVPTCIVHARDDRVCPWQGAALLHERLPHSILRCLPVGGHDPSHPLAVDAMVRALDRFAERSEFA